MAPTDIRKIIRGLEERIEVVPDATSRAFVRAMVAKLDKYGDALYCTFRQRQYLLSLYRQTAPVSTEKPKSRLDELRERKAQILRGQHKRRVRASKAADLDSAGGIPILAHLSTDGVNAKMRHARSIARELHHSPLLITGTKRA